MDFSQLRSEPLLTKGSSDRRDSLQVPFAHKYSIESDPFGLSSPRLKEGKKVASRALRYPEMAPLRSCEVAECGMIATGGVCSYSVMGGLSKGCGRNFCTEHCGSQNEDFQVSNDDEFRSCSTACDSFDEECPDNRTENKKPFEGKVCQECRPRLSRAYKFGVTLLCGVPTLISVAALVACGGV